MRFLTDVDHVSFGKAKETRQINLLSATVSLQGKRQTSPRIKGRHLKETVAHRDGGQLFCST